MRSHGVSIIQEIEIVYINSGRHYCEWSYSDAVGAVYFSASCWVAHTFSSVGPIALTVTVHSPIGEDRTYSATVVVYNDITVDTDHVELYTTQARISLFILLLGTFPHDAGITSFEWTFLSPDGNGDVYLQVSTPNASTVVTFEESGEYTFTTVIERPNGSATLHGQVTVYSELYGEQSLRV